MVDIVLWRRQYDYLFPIEYWWCLCRRRFEVIQEMRCEWRERLGGKKYLITWKCSEWEEQFKEKRESYCNLSKHLSSLLRAGELSWQLMTGEK